MNVPLSAKIPYMVTKAVEKHWPANDVNYLDLWEARALADKIIKSIQKDDTKFDEKQLNQMLS